MIIRIDTSKDPAILEFEGKARLPARQGNKERFEFKNARGLDNSILWEIEKRLKKGKLEKIEVNSGPGRYTGLRTGIVIVNTLIEVFGLPQGLVFPQYPKG